MLRLSLVVSRMGLCMEHCVLVSQVFCWNNWWKLRKYYDQYMGNTKTHWKIEGQKPLDFYTGDAELVIPCSDGEEDDLPADPDARSTSVLVEEAAASTGLAKRMTGVEEQSTPAAKRARGVEMIAWNWILYHCHMEIFALNLF